METKINFSDPDWFLDVTDEDREILAKDYLAKRYGVAPGQPLHDRALREIEELERQLRIRMVIAWVAGYLCLLCGAALMAWVGG